MDYKTFQGLVYGARREDWLYDEDNGIYTFINDLNITIRDSREHEARPFNDTWHQGLPDPTATRSIHELYFGASYVCYEYIVNVDGGRARIPLPKDPRASPWITKNQYAFGKIIDHPDTLDEYLRRCKIEVR